MTVLVDWPLEEWAFSRALFPMRFIQERCARKKHMSSMSEKPLKRKRCTLHEYQVAYYIYFPLPPPFLLL